MPSKQNIYSNRIERLINKLDSEKLDFIAINAGQTLSYYTGLRFHLSERPVILLIGKNQDPAFIFPEFEEEKVKNASVKLMPIAYPENQSLWTDAFKDAMRYFNISEGSAIGVEPTALRFLEIDLIRSALKDLKFISAAPILEDLRMIKDKNEVEMILQAIHVAQSAMESTIPFIKIGRTEKEIANELVIHLLRNGSEPDLPFTPIVASGPNSANPHAIPGDRGIDMGDFLIIDWGARIGGYISDITRTFAIGNADEKMKSMYQIVMNANKNAREIHGENLTSGIIDKAARDIIANAGYGDYFIHRTGHGIGLDAHEAPYISSINQMKIKPGMTFTIEPGIYIPEQGGIRIEDNVVVKENNLETLTTLARELIIL